MISIRDIAKETGYSITTVGAVLRDQAERFGIKRETKEKILAVSRSLGYCKNDLAAQMKSGQSRTLLMLLNDSSAYYTPAVLNACNTATRNNYILRLAYTTGTENFEEYVQSLFQQRPAALLYLGDPGNREKTILNYVQRYAIPYITLDFENPHATLNILFEQAAGIREAVLHLKELGHTRIVHATDTLAAQYAQQRLTIYRDIMHENGLELDDSLCFHDRFLDDSTALKQYAVRLAAMPPEQRPTAITCGSDYMEVKLLFFFTRLGLRVPEDISLVGFGGISMLTLSIEPKLTTIDQRLELHGRVSIEKTLALLKKIPTPDPVRIPTALLRGETTAPVNKNTRKQPHNTKRRNS